ncbi:hypothetical protein E8L90_26640 [Brevibacillus antibioticus]|uniref:Uncharacterized protein n=1 Tax=Brevibacillus antibioticus TaxID=2570228 RepID=A0A4U2YCV7_9BACL|nr:hypothetical protein [Brevibacillus antibioticus]TKI58687.1 hypothetical protein E8L90_26640 [Brevibacillus antibioticus]
MRKQTIYNLEEALPLFLYNGAGSLIIKESPETVEAVLDNHTSLIHQQGQLAIAESKGVQKYLLIKTLEKSKRSLHRNSYF